jgi:hypothetical protein
MDPSLPPPSPAFPLTHISYLSVLEDRRRVRALSGREGRREGGRKGGREGGRVTVEEE